MNIEDLFLEDTPIPSLPEVYYKFKEAVEDADTSFNEISEIIKLEPGLAARLLRIVNSAFYGFPSSIETIPHAISIVGMDQLNDLVLSTVVMSRFKEVSVDSMDMESFWKHSLACGLAAKTVASRIKIIAPEKIFTAGLLHDIGRIVICLNAPFQFLSVFLKTKDKSRYLHEVEREVMGFDHGEAGGLLLKKWKLPELHTATVEHHHDQTGMASFVQEATIIDIADTIANSLEIGTSGEGCLPNLQEKAKAIPEIAREETLSAIKEEVQEQFENCAAIFLQSA